jgi:hypothetical protein
MIAGEAPEILDPWDNTGLAPRFDRVARIVTDHSRWERSTGKICRPLQKIRKTPKPSTSIILRFTSRFFGSHSARKENSWPEEIRHQHGRGRNSRRTKRDSLVATLFLTRLMHLKPAWRRPKGRQRLGSRQLCGWRRGALLFRCKRRFETTRRSLGHP